MMNKTTISKDLLKMYQTAQSQMVYWQSCHDSVNEEILTMDSRKLELEEKITSGMGKLDILPAVQKNLIKHDISVWKSEMAQIEKNKKQYQKLGSISQKLSLVYGSATKDFGKLFMLNDEASLLQAKTLPLNLEKLSKNLDEQIEKWQTWKNRYDTEAEQFMDKYNECSDSLHDLRGKLGQKDTKKATNNYLSEIKKLETERKQYKELAVFYSKVDKIANSISQSVQIAKEDVEKKVLASDTTQIKK